MNTVGIFDRYINFRCGLCDHYERGPVRRYVESEDGDWLWLQCPRCKDAMKHKKDALPFAA